MKQRKWNVKHESSNTKETKLLDAAEYQEKVKFENQRQPKSEKTKDQQLRHDVQNVIGLKQINKS